MSFFFLNLKDILCLDDGVYYVNVCALAFFFLPSRRGRVWDNEDFTEMGSLLSRVLSL